VYAESGWAKKGNERNKQASKQAAATSSSALGVVVVTVQLQRRMPAGRPHETEAQDKVVRWQRSSTQKPRRGSLSVHVRTTHPDEKAVVCPFIPVASHARNKDARAAVPPPLGLRRRGGGEGSLPPAERLLRHCGRIQTTPRARPVVSSVRYQQVSCQLDRPTTCPSRRRSGTRPEEEGSGKGPWRGYTRQ